jgi:cobalt-zinc-cadmium efflux system protein
MQGTPAGFDADQLRQHLMQAVPELTEVHQIHVWALTEGKPVISLHARLQVGSDFTAVLASIKRVLRDNFDLHHSVVQLESAQDQCPD